MQIDKVTIAIRPRTAFEGIDLGFTMARKWFLPLWLLWLVTALPAFLFFFLVFQSNLMLAILFTWWLKPLYESPLLYWLSRAVFNQKLRIRDILKLIVMIVKPRLLRRLTIYRFNPNRSFYLPVTLLENMTKRDYRERTSLLGRNQSAGIGLTLICLVFECVIQVSFSILILTLIPEEFRWAGLGDTFFPGPLESTLDAIFCFLAMSFVAPFYTAAGFSLYLSRRTDLEAWDIELGFRRLMERRKMETSLKKKTSTTHMSTGSMIVAMILSVCTFIVIMVSPGQAEVISREKAGQAIDEVLQHPDFGEKKTGKQWIRLNDNDTEKDPFDFSDLSWLKMLSQMLAVLGEIILWITGGVLLAWLILKISKSRMKLLLMSKHNKPMNNKPDKLFGLNVNENSLPHDILSEATGLLDKNNLRDALSLLYRGTLAELIHKSGLEIPESATEMECVLRVEELRQKEEAVFFKHLTETWLIMAYALNPPDKKTIQRIFDTWQIHYGVIHE